MPDTAPQPIVVSPNQGGIDALQAAGRYIVVILTILTGLLALVRVKDWANAAVYVQQNLGQFMGAVTGLIGIGTALYGVYKTHKRGAQATTVAAEPRVPSDVAHLSTKG